MVKEFDTTIKIPDGYIVIKDGKYGLADERMNIIAKPVFDRMVADEVSAYVTYKGETYIIFRSNMTLHTVGVDNLVGKVTPDGIKWYKREDSYDIPIDEALEIVTEAVIRIIGNLERKKTLKESKHATYGPVARFFPMLNTYLLLKDDMALDPGNQKDKQIVCKCLAELFFTTKDGCVWSDKLKAFLDSPYNCNRMRKKVVREKAYEQYRQKEKDGTYIPDPPKMDAADMETFINAPDISEINEGRHKK